MQRGVLALLLSAGVTQVAWAQLSPPPAPPENPVTEAKRVLGKLLFWEEQLSSDNTMACATCHVPGSGGADLFNVRQAGGNELLGDADDVFGSLGVVHTDLHDEYLPDPAFGFDRQVTGRQSQSIYTAGYSRTGFWDGRASGEFRDPLTNSVVIPHGAALESQGLVPILSSVEMSHEGRTWPQVIGKLERVEPMALATNLPADMGQAIAGGSVGYSDLFASAFGSPGITPVRIAFAIATYERTLVPNQTPWDRFIAGQSGALTANQQAGWNAFNGKQLRCAECHEPPLFSDNSFRNIGLRPIAEDRGRQEVTGRFADRGRFKVPSLRNVGLRPNFFHNGDPSVATLLEAVQLYDGAGGNFPENRDPILDGLIVPLNLSGAVVDFLENGLTDPRVAAALPPFDRPTLGSDQPFLLPSLVGTGVPGSAGTPRMHAHRPPNVGHQEFQLGLSNSLGGAYATIAWTVNDPLGPTMGAPLTFGGAIRLNGDGPGEGYGTWKRAIPTEPTLIGLEVWAQWWIRDPAAPLGLAKSRWARSTIF